jgi:hypothetical protein
MNDSPPRAEPAPPSAEESRQAERAYRTGDHFRMDTPAGALDMRVMRTYPDGTVDILCSCCGARWERRRLRLQSYDMDGTVPAA